MIDTIQAEKVNLIFNTYLEIGNVRLLKNYLEENDIVSGQRISSKGNISGNKPFSRGHLYKILSNRIYIGQIEHKDLIHDGQHEAIITLETWNAVQAQLQSATVMQVGKLQSKRSNNLQGKLFDPDGVIYTPTYTKKGNKHYRYYISQNLLQYKNHPKRLIARIPASEIESTLSTVVKEKLVSNEYWAEAYPTLDYITVSQIANYLSKTTNTYWLSLIHKVIISPDKLEVMIDNLHMAKILLDELCITLPAQETKETVISAGYNASRAMNGAIIIKQEGKSKDRLDLPANTLKKLVQGVVWREEHFNGTTLTAIAKANDCSWAYVSNCIDFSLSF